MYFPIPDLSHGGYQDHQNSNKYNGIVTQNPLKSLVNTKRHEPYFDPNVPKNITALVGKSAYLNCIVKNLGNKTVEYNFPINRNIQIFPPYLLVCLPNIWICSGVCEMVDCKFWYFIYLALGVTGRFLGRLNSEELW